MAAACSTAPPACGASMPAIAARRSSRRSASRRASSTSPAPSRWAIRKPSKPPPSSSMSRRPASTMCSSPIRDRNPSRPRSRSRSPITAPRATARSSRLIGRERGYHGVNFGGMSVGGIANNRKMFGTLLSGVDHIRHTHDLARNAFSRGEPEHGAELADDLERLVALHDASTIAAVIVEPVSCSAGVLIPPKGYLKRLAAICAKHDILLIFDEVITAFGRLGTPVRRRLFRRLARHHHHGEGRHQRRRAHGRGVRQVEDPSGLHERARKTPSTSSMATPIRAIRSPAPLRSPRSSFTRRRGS